MEELTKDKSVEEQIHDMELEGRVLFNDSYSKYNDPNIMTTEDRVDSLDDALTELIKDYLKEQKEFKDQLQQLWHCISLLGKIMEMIYNYLKGEETCPTNQESLEQKSPSSETPEVSKKP